MSDDDGDLPPYSFADLLGQFGQRWSIAPRDYLDGERLAAEPRPKAVPFIPITAASPAEMRDRLLAEEAAAHRRGE